MEEKRWKTAISKVQPNEVRLRGYRVDELMGRITFPQAVYLALKGELPDENVGKLIDAILISSVDHGVTPPSTLTARTVASTGSPLNAALAAGATAISRFHGGAIEDCMAVLLQVRDKMDNDGLNLKEAAQQIVEEYRQIGRRISGFGHRLHKQDPRTSRLFDLAQAYGIGEEFIAIARAIEEALAEQLGKTLPINVDGAIAALLCALEFPPSLANAFFIMARMPGLVAHIHEEQTRYKPMRTIDSNYHEYDGPPDRSLEP